ncbi:hypothetical protein [Azospirillum largimobile]
MMAKRRAESWNDGWSDRDAPGGAPDDGANRTGARPASGRPECGRPPWKDREGRLVEALLECTTIAGLFALLFALFVLFGAAHTLAP